MTRFVKRIFVFSIIIAFGLGVLVFVSKKDGEFGTKSDDSIDFETGDGFLAPGSSLR